MNRFLKSLALVVLLALPWVGIASAQQVNLYCFIEGSSPPKWTPCSAANALQITGSFSIAGTTSNASSAVATSSTNLPTVSYNYGFNGTTWDQLQVDGSKNLKVVVSSGGGLSVADQAAWTQGASSFTPAGGVFNDTATLSSGQQGTVRLTTDRQMKVLDSAVLAAVQAAIPAGTNLIGDVNLRQGGNVLSATNGIFGNTLQGNAVLSATNGIYTNLLVGNAAVATGTGAQGATSPRVTTATDTATIAGSAPGTAGTASSNVVTIQHPSVDPCETVVQTSTPISITTATTTRIVAPTSAKKTYICYLFLTSAAADNIGIVEGTGGTCGSGTAGVIGGTTAANGPNFAANGGMSLTAGGKTAVAFTAGTNVDLCLITSAATPLAGVIKWVQGP